jgi:hypothetical protein
MQPDLQTQVAGLNLDARRRTKGLPDLLLFENRELDGTFTTLGSVTSGWCGDETAGETLGVPEYQVLVIWRTGGLDTWVQQCSAVNIGGTRYEKRAVDPAVGSPAIIRLRCQPITGYASY